MSFKNSLCLAILGASVATISACQSTRSYPDNSVEIQQLETQHQAAKQQQLDVLAPSEYKRFADRLEDAKERAAKKKDTTDAVRDSQAALADMQERSEASRAILTDVLAARQAALEAGADRLKEDAFEDVDDDLESMTRRAARGNIRSLQSSRDELKNRYDNIQADAIVINHLGATQKRFEAAKKDDADDDAPKTYKRAETKLQEAERAIRANRTDSAAIEEAVQMASTEVDRLVKITADAQRLNSEESAIELYERDQRALAERQRLEGMNSSLANRLETQRTASEEAAAALARTQENLQSTQQNLMSAEAAQMLEQRYVEARNTFTPQEADVYKDGSNLLIRLKGLTFANGKAELPTNSERVLTKLDKVIQEFEGAEVVVEGHTDATGSRAINERLSQERADAVKDYLVSKNIVESERVMSEGYGFEKPIASNRSADGRALNRRVDVIIAPTEKAEAPTATAPNSGTDAR